MARLRYNGLATTLGAALAAGDTAITFAAALTHSGGTAVPTITGSDYIPLTILNGAGGVSEIVSLTAYTSGTTTGTITRAQESTTAVAHASGDAVVHSPTVTDFTASSGGSMTLLKQVTLAADTASVAFSSADIPASGYSHLRLQLIGRSTAASAGDSVSIAFNSDTTTANYKYQVHQGATSATTAGTAASRTIAYLDAASNPAGTAGVVTIDILDYLGSWQKMAQSQSSKSGDPVVASFMVRWANAAAITAVSLTCGANFKAGTKAWLYGVL